MRFLLLLAAGCNLVGTNTLSIDYSFDPQEYRKDLGNTMGNFPSVACTATNDPCSQAAMALPSGITTNCDTTAKQCRANAEVLLNYPIDLSMQSTFPQSAISVGINFVNIKKVEYWVVSNTLTVSTPPVDLYVAPASAKDQTMGTLLGSISPLSPKSAACSDARDSDSAAGSLMVCDVTLNQAGVDALANFAKDYKTEFQIIAHATVTAEGGEPIPAGAIDFVVRPVISIGIVR
jgi:hypothetical protein